MELRKMFNLCILIYLMTFEGWRKREEAGLQRLWEGVWGLGAPEHHSPGTNQKLHGPGLLVL